MNFRNIIQDYFTKGHPRTLKARKNILGSFGVKGLTMAIGIFKVPLLLSYLAPEKYGVWITVAGLVTWINYFDLGLSHGLRNKLAVAFANNDYVLGAKLVSTAYFSLLLFSCVLFILLTPLVFFLDWNNILNTTQVENNELAISVFIVLVVFLFRFVATLIMAVLRADQRPAMADVFLPISSVLGLLFIVLLKLFSHDSLVLACIVTALPPLIVMIIINIYSFSKRYKALRPRLSLFDKFTLRSIFSLGIKFFIIQIVAMIMFSFSNLIIAKVTSPLEVTKYSISNQMFHYIMMLFMIVLTPYWSAITDAYARKEFGWIKSSMNNLFFIALIGSIAIVALLGFSDFILKLWIGDRVSIPFSLRAVIALYFILQMFLAPLSHFINGVGKLNLGMRIVIGKGIVYLPIAIFMTGKYGPIGLVTSLIIINTIPSLITGYIQYKKIVEGTARGIWNR
jgi:O-antigen/teichoic acid export membrane protein